MTQKRPGFWKSLLMGATGIGLSAAFYATANFGTLEKEVKKVDQSAQAVYTQMVTDNSYTYLDYKAKISPQIIQVEQTIEQLMQGQNGALTKQQRVQAWRNLVNGYRSSQTKLSRFENDLNILDAMVKKNWTEFSDNQNNFKIRLNQILTSLINSRHELHTVKKIMFQNMQQNQNHQGLTDIQSNDLSRKIEINRETLQQSYKLFEWYRLILVEKVEYWRLMNPKDAKLTQKEYEHFLAQIKSIQFDVNK